MEISLGSGVKKPTPTDLANIPIVRKSIVAACPIAKGEMLTEKNITAKRPGTGISPMRWDEIIGRRANRNYEQDEFIEA
jgi:sialic acid synthase SpsE